MIARKEWAGRKLPDMEISYPSGEELFRAKSCNACHSINGKGGEIAPDLSTLGRRRTKEWIIYHFIDPHAQVAGSIMPDFKLSRTEIEALTYFLLQQTGKTE